MAAFLATPAIAQVSAPSPYAVVSADPIDRLSAHLRTLAVSPRNYLALIGAGDAALQVGDPNAALGFFARAEQVDPRSGKAKAGLASALVALERPNDALPLFAQAVALGVSEADIARDRGLAYDLRGDSKRAQHDYALALKSNSTDDETVRRYALSLGISGQRAEAMALLTPLLQKKDQSAWRARAFILAMTGDVSGANGIARQVMPANLAAAMAPFLARLASLNPADRAHAVNFGTIPSNGVQMASVEIGEVGLAAGSGAFKPIGGGASAADRGFTTPGAGSATGTGLIPAGEPLGPKPTRVIEPLSNDPRRIPGRDNAPAVSPAPVFPAPAAPGFTVAPEAPPPSVESRFGAAVSRIAPVDPAKLPPEARGAGTPSVIVAQDRVALPAPTPAAAAPGAAPLKDDAPAFETTPTGGKVASVAPAPQSSPAPADTPASPAIVSAPPPLSSVAEKAAGLVGPPAAESNTTVTTASSPAVVPPVAVVPAVPQTAPAPPRSRLAAILEGVTPESETAAVALPSAAEIRAQRRLAAKKAEAAAAAAAAAQAEKDAKAAAAALAKANPARLWVQVATGNNTRGLAGTWARIRDANEKLLKGKTAYSVPFKATNRLLVGPMKSGADARALVNALAKEGVAATIFNSEAGQEVARVGAK